MTVSAHPSNRSGIQSPTDGLLDRLAALRVLAMDVDGVLTDGTLIYSDSGEEIKAFNAKDGLGIRLLLEEGIPVCLITGRSSKALRHRCKNLGISFVYDGVSNKKSVLNRICADTGSKPEDIAFAGDDLPDLSMKGSVGLFIAVADAHEALLETADWVTSARGGKGAVREICEAILKAKGLWLKNLWLSS
jgi:3-deoxy-D-manno-octulosonate 8-phosphate phosphatase (KDO 8-P phosphatase)